MNSIVVFEAENQPVKVRLEGETVWLSQAQLADLFGTSADNVSLHLKNIFKDDEARNRLFDEADRRYTVIAATGQTVPWS